MNGALKNTITVRNRFSRQLYSITLHDFHKIRDLIHMYHETIYNLPDEEQVVAIPIASDSQDRCLIKVNEIVFV